MSELVQVTVHEEPLSDEQIVGLLRTWTAGHGTVAAALGNVVRYLAEDAELQTRLRSEPRLVEAATWEILRMDGPLVSNARTATRDLEIDGQAIGAGERISLMWIAANRDPAAFTDPEHVVLDRGTDGNLLFGAGIHRCLGETLAILNVRVAVEELLRRVARFEPRGAERATPKCLSEQRSARTAASHARFGRGIKGMKADAGSIRPSPRERFTAGVIHRPFTRVSGLVHRARIRSS
jgi:cytochrome P450